jgi:hypothetical protein
MKSILSLFIILILTYTAPLSAATTDKFLFYQFSPTVVISISNLSCSMSKYKQEYPFAAIAIREDKAVLIGCYKKETEDLIKIQWQDIDNHPSDFTIIPANAFLMEPPERFKDLFKKKPVLKKELEV